MDQPSTKLRVAAMAATLIALVALSVPFVWQHSVEAEPSAGAPMTPVASHGVEPEDDAEQNGAAIHVVGLVSHGSNPYRLRK